MRIVTTFEYRYMLMAVAVCLLASCNGILSGIYDEPPAEEEAIKAFDIDPSDPSRLTLQIDARAYDKWYFIDMHRLTVEERDIPLTLTGDHDGISGWTYHLVQGDTFTKLSEIKTDPQPEPEQWDIALHHFDFRTNGGEAAETQLSSLDMLPDFAAIAPTLTFEKDVWSDHQAITDLTGMMAYRIGYQNSYISRPLTRMATMDFSTPPPTYSTSGRVCIIRLADGSRAAVKMRTYMSAAGIKGYLTLDFIYPYE